ncbi:MAG: hypothetical protein AB7S61_07295 [Methanoregulaceae archaeon]
MLLARGPSPRPVLYLVPEGALVERALDAASISRMASVVTFNRSFDG